MRLRAHWTKASCDIDTKITPLEKITALESRCRITLPEDFRTYLLETCPDTARVSAWDNWDYIWWPIEDIGTIAEQYEQPIAYAPIAAAKDKYIFFADYCIWFWAWAICCTDDENRGKVAVIGEPAHFVADSFSDFVERYIRDPYSLFPNRSEN